MCPTRSSPTARRRASRRAEDLCGVAGRAGETFVGRDQGGIECLSQRNVRGIVGRQIVPELEDSLEKLGSRIPTDREFEEVVEHLLATARRDRTQECQSSDRRSDFEVDHVWSADAARRTDAFSRPLTSIAILEAQVNDRCRVDNDYQRLSRSSRSARMISAELTGSLISFRFRTRSTHSWIVGVAALSDSSETRYSWSDIPALRARSFIVRWASGGTLRIWICATPEA